MYKPLYCASACAVTPYHTIPHQPSLGPKMGSGGGVGGGGGGGGGGGDGLVVVGCCTIPHPSVFCFFNPQSSILNLHLTAPQCTSVLKFLVSSKSFYPTISPI